MAFSQRVAAWGACQIQEANERYFQVVALVPDDCGGLQAALTASNFLGVTDSAEPGFMTQEAEDACKRERERRGLK